MEIPRSDLRTYFFNRISNRYISGMVYRTKSTGYSNKRPLKKLSFELNMDFIVEMESKLQNTKQTSLWFDELNFFQTFKRTYLGANSSYRVHRECKLKVLLSALKCILQFEHLWLFNFRKTGKIENFKKLKNATSLLHMNEIIFKRWEN